MGRPAHCAAPQVNKKQMEVDIKHKKVVGTKAFMLPCRCGTSKGVNSACLTQQEYELKPICLLGSLKTCTNKHADAFRT